MNRSFYMKKAIFLDAVKVMNFEIEKDPGYSLQCNQNPSKCPISFLLHKCAILHPFHCGAFCPFLLLLLLEPSVLMLLPLQSQCSQSFSTRASCRLWDSVPWPLFPLQDTYAYLSFVKGKLCLQHQVSPVEGQRPFCSPSEKSPSQSLL